MSVAISTPLQPLTVENAGSVEEIAQLGQDYDEPVRVLAFSPDGQTIACSTHKRVYLWDAHWRQLRFEQPIAAQSLAFSPDGNTLVAAGEKVVFLSVPEGEQPMTLKGHPGGTTCVAYSPDGEMLATGGMDGVVRIGNLQTRKLVSQLEHPAPVRALAFSPAGETIATICWGDDDQSRHVHLWQVMTGTQIGTLPCAKEKHLAYSPDGALLAVDGKIFEVETGDVRYNLKERQVAFSPDGRLAATCHHNFDSVGLWDMSTGEKIASLTGHSDRIWQVAFGPDGIRLASCSGSLRMSAALRGEEDVDDSDYSLRLWGVPDVTPEEQAEKAKKQRRPLKRLGEADESEDEGLLRPVTGLLNRFSR